MTNPLLSKLQLPGQLFQLPSRGVFYDETIVDKKTIETDGQIEVRPHTTMSEIYLRSPDMLYSGRSFGEICKICAPSIKNADALLTYDVDAIFIMLKIASEGPKMTLKYKHNCISAKDHTYEIDIQTVLNDCVPNFDMKKHKEMAYSVTMPNGQKVNLTPQRFYDLVRSTHAIDDLARINRGEDTPNNREQRTYLMREYEISQLISKIADVDGYTDSRFIREWIEIMPANYRTLIEEAWEQAETWHKIPEYKFVCHDCNAQITGDLVDLNAISFFKG